MGPIITPPTKENPLEGILPIVISLVLGKQKPRSQTLEEPSNTTVHLFNSCVSLLSQLGFRIGDHDGKLIPTLENAYNNAGPKRKSMIVVLISHIFEESSEVKKMLSEAARSDVPEAMAAAALGNAFKMLRETIRQKQQGRILQATSAPPPPIIPR